MSQPIRISRYRFDMGDKPIKNLKNPTSNFDAATKKYGHDNFTTARRGGRNIWVRNSAPTAEQEGDIWVDNSFIDDSNIKTQRGLITFTGTSGYLVLGTPVPQASSFVITTTRGTDTETSRSTVRAYLATASGGNWTRLYVARNTATGTTYIEWQVITGPDFTVQSGTMNHSDGVASKTANISAVTLAKSFITHSSQAQGGTTQMNRVMSRARFTSTTQIELAANAVTTTFYPITTWYVVEWDSASVQSGLTTLSSSSANRSITAVDLSKTFLIHNYNCTNLVTARETFTRAIFTSTTNVVFQKGTTTGTTYNNVFVVSHDKILVQSGTMTISGTSGTDNLTTQVNLDNSFMPSVHVGNAYGDASTTGTLHTVYNTHKLYEDGSTSKVTIERTTSTSNLYAGYFVVESLKEESLIKFWDSTIQEWKNVNTINYYCDGQWEEANSVYYWDGDSWVQIYLKS